MRVIGTARGEPQGSLGSAPLRSGELCPPGREAGAERKGWEEGDRAAVLGAGGSSSRWGPPAAAGLQGRSSESPPHGSPAKVGFFKSGPCAPRTACGTARPQEHFGVTDDRPADLMQSGAASGGRPSGSGPPVS